MEKGKKVFVAMSGGVDSSVAAYLLHEAGYTVTGVFMRVWQPDFLPCTAEEERRDAMRVAADLGISFLTFDFEEAYKRDVVDYLIREYALGRTPNPDIMCNRHIKFGVFREEALARGADFIATGHYARVTEDHDGFRLRTGIDTTKDQSYFLYTLGQRELRELLLPVGGLLKKEVREIARKVKLSTAEKKDSQGLCFLGKLDMQSFLKHYVPVTRGDVVDERGRVVGEHEGALLYTEGQRHGFTVWAKNPHESPYFVTAKDVSHNTLTVSHMPRGSEQDIHLTETHFIGAVPAHGRRYGVRLRYRQPLMVATIRRGVNADALVTLEKPLAIIPAGQSLVIYDGEECIGGGIIA